MMAILPAELPVDPYPLAHCNPACNIDITVTPFRVCGKCKQRLLKQYCNTFRGDLFCYRITGSFLHCLMPFPCCAKYQRRE